MANCAACTACPDDYYASVPCTGRTSQNTVCTACRMHCPEKQFMTNRCFQSNHPTTNDPNANMCKPCEPCRDGYFQARVCSAGGILSNRSDDRVCAQCITECPAGQYLSGVCDPTGSNSPPICVNCVLCNEGERRVENCTKTTPGYCVADPSCFESCAVGYYRVSGCTDGNLPICKPCSGCQVGQFISRPCTQNNNLDDVCTPCKLLCNGDSNAQYGSCPGNLLTDTIGCSVDNYTISDKCPANYYQVGYSDFNYDVSKALVRLPGLNPYAFGLRGTSQQMVFGVAPAGKKNPHFLVKNAHFLLLIT